MNWQICLTRKIAIMGLIRNRKLDQLMTKKREKNNNSRWAENESKVSQWLSFRSIWILWLLSVAYLNIKKSLRTMPKVRIIRINIHLFRTRRLYKNSLMATFKMILRKRKRLPAGLKRQTKSIVKFQPTVFLGKWLNRKNFNPFYRTQVPKSHFSSDHRREKLRSSRKRWSKKLSYHQEMS